jgi:hypothetical protein
MTISPGQWSAWTISGDLTLRPGLYVVNGDISLKSGSITGQGVTIVTTGTLTAQSKNAITLAAPPSSSSGGIPGIAFATSTSGILSFQGNTDLDLGGTIYAPTGTVDIGGNLSDTDSAVCAQFIVGSLSHKGAFTFRKTCSPTAGTSVAGSSSQSVALVR